MIRDQSSNRGDLLYPLSHEQAPNRMKLCEDTQLHCLIKSESHAYTIISRHPVGILMIRDQFWNALVAVYPVHHKTTPKNDILPECSTREPVEKLPANPKSSPRLWILKKKYNKTIEMIRISRRFELECHCKLKRYKRTSFALFTTATRTWKMNACRGILKKRQPEFKSTTTP